MRHCSGRRRPLTGMSNIDAVRELVVGIHCRLSHDSLLCYAALCTVGHLVRKVS